MAQLLVTVQLGRIVAAISNSRPSALLIMNADRTDCTRVRIVADAVVGGGAVLRQGEIVDRERFGEHADCLCEFGAIEPFRDEELEQLGP